MEYIKKENLKDGGNYLGFCRNASIAQWDAREDRFLYIRRKFGTDFIDQIHHFDDVKEIRIDGFIPFEEIRDVRSDPEIRKYVKELGY